MPIDIIDKFIIFTFIFLGFIRILDSVLIIDKTLEYFF